MRAVPYGTTRRELQRGSEAPGSISFYGKPGYAVSNVSDRLRLEKVERTRRVPDTCELEPRGVEETPPLAFGPFDAAGHDTHVQVHLGRLRQRIVVGKDALPDQQGSVLRNRFAAVREEQGGQSLDSLRWQVVEVRV